MKNYLRVRLKNDVGNWGFDSHLRQTLCFVQMKQCMHVNSNTAGSRERGASCNTLVLNNFHTCQHDETWHICHFNTI